MRGALGIVVACVALSACGELLGAPDEEASNGTPPGVVDGSALGDGPEGGDPDVGGPDDDAGDAGDAAFTTKDSGPRVVFVSSTALMTGTQLSGKNADDACNQLAAGAGLDGGKGGFVAWLSTSKLAAKDKLLGDGPWLDTRGNTIAKTRSNLLSGTLTNPIAFTEDGGSTGGPVGVWTGTLTNGTWSGASCGAWDNTGAAANLSTEGANDLKDGGWTDRGGKFNDCLAVPGLHIYCFEQP